MSDGPGSLVGSLAIQRCMKFVRFIGRIEVGQACEIVCKPLKRALIKSNRARNHAHLKAGLCYISYADIQLVFHVSPAGNPSRALVTRVAISRQGITHKFFGKLETQTHEFAL